MSEAWDLYRSFLAVAETGSLSSAARRLRLTQPTVGRHIEALEATLGGAALFTRSPRGMRPTELAESLRPHAETMAAAAQALARVASGEVEAAEGVVRLTVSEVVGAEVLPPMLTAFRRAQPRIDIELVMTDAQQDLLRRDADIAVRMARPTQGALYAARVGAVRVEFHAHRRYLAARGEPRTLDDLSDHDLIGFDRRTLEIASLRATGIPLDPRQFALRSDSDLAQLACLRAGFGIGACQQGLARRDPNLVPVLREAFHFDLEVWVAMHEDLKRVRRLRLLFDHLVEGLKAYVAESRPD